MNLQHKYILFCAILFIIVPITLSTLTGKITATDWVYRHSVWIQQYLRGDFSPVFLYPPLFEFLMLPFVSINFPMQYFQIIFVMSATFGILFYTWKMESEETLLYAAMMLASSIAFVEFAGSLMPQALDYFIFPLICLAYFKRKYAAAIIGLTAITMMHNTGMIFIGILFFHALLKEDWKFVKIFLVMILIFSPMFYYYQFVIKFDFWDSNAQELWEQSYLNPFWKFFALSGLLTWILIPYACWKLWINDWYHLRKKKFIFTDAQKLYIVWIVAFISLGIFHQGIWRMISYQIVPLSLLVASLVSKK